MAVTPPRRNALIDRYTPGGRPVFRVRSRTGPASYLVVTQPDGRMVCNCEAAGFHSTCYHARRATASYARRGMTEAEAQWRAAR